VFQTSHRLLLICLAVGPTSGDDPKPPTAVGQKANPRPESVEVVIETLRGQVADLQSAQASLNATEVRDLKATDTKIDRLTKALADAEDRLKRQAEELNRAMSARVDSLGLRNPPIGTVTAFAGDWPPKRTETTSWTEAELGWLKCDGRSYEELQSTYGIASDTLQPLALVLPGKALPDYQGYFLRGIDREVADPRLRRDKDGRRAPGSPPQVHATARPSNPEKPFKTDVKAAEDLTSPGSNRQGAAIRFNLLMARTPTIPFTNPFQPGFRVYDNTAHEGDYTAGEPDLFTAGEIKAVPEHSHKVTEGGDDETRPINFAIHWIIRFR
jgi:hypothetical protein